MSLPAQPNRSLIDGFAALQELAGRGRALGGRELARELGLDPTRVHRLLKTLAHLGLLEQTVDRKYQPGPGMHVLAAQSLFGSGLVRRALPHLQRLHRHGHVVALGVLWRDHVSYLYHAEPDMPVADALGRVGVFPATQSGIGMVLLARRSSDEVRRLFADRSTSGHANVDALLAELADIRHRGYALIGVDRREPGRSSLAVAIDGSTTATAAVALSGRLPPPAGLSPLVESLREAAAAIASPPV